MKALSPKSKGILDRALIHKDRCLQIAFSLGEDAGTRFHEKFKSNPGSQDAEKEFKRLIQAGSN